MEIIPYDRHRLQVISTQPTVVIDRPTIFSITGPGAGTCLQGILSGDVLGPGPATVGYAGALSPKGMVLFDVWWIRLEPQFFIVADREAREALRDHLTRQLPPRLARLTDLSDSYAAGFVLGPRQSSLGLDDSIAAGTVRSLPSGLIVARASAGGPFAAIAIGPEATVREELPSAVGREITGTALDLKAARILAGVPTLGVDIDDRTLPQEVRFDELAGVSYSKGCFVGQETVARLHFRGHPNWMMRGVAIPAGTFLPQDGMITVDGKPALRLGSLMQLDDGQILGLAKVRREIAVGDEIPVDRGSVGVRDLPFRSIDQL